jgi:YebC/PmpR family DNA-binding regulatory protein
MAKHSHWDNIKHKKAVNDKAKAAVIAKMGVILTVAVQMGGPKPEDNPRLRLAIAKARAASMNMEAIERAINKAAGLGLDGKQMSEVTYEGYAPGGIAVVASALTDNRNRTAPEIKKLFERAGGSVGSPGCVAWQFTERSVFLVTAASEDRVMEALLAADADAEDIIAEDGESVAITAAPAQFDAITRALTAAGIPILSSDIKRIADNLVEVGAIEGARAVQDLIDSLEEHPDIQSVAHNAAYSDAVLAQLG